VDYQNMTAPCGLPCFNCPLYKANFDEALKKKVSQSLNVSEDKVVCKGCRNEDGTIAYLDMTEPCFVYRCIHQKNLNFCYECDDFPCDYLHPYADMATTKPHNLKVFNLCLIKKMGLEGWAREKARDVMRTYYKEKWKI
jgi:hypothetical protein